MPAIVTTTPYSICTYASPRMDDSPACLQKVADGVSLSPRF